MKHPLPAEARAVLRRTAEELAESGIEDPLKEAEIIVTTAAHLGRLELYRDNPALKKEALEKIASITGRRRKREPLQYVLGSVEFFGLAITVGRGVLIPRPETELLAEEVLRRADRKKALRLLDLCTGSGCLALALAKSLPLAELTGIDISETALSYAVKNAGLNRIENARFLRGDLFEPVKGERFDFIVSNPPYVESGEMETLEPEIKDWEPRRALDGGPDGLDCYRMILRDSSHHLKDKGMVLLELGHGQAGRVAGLARSSGLEVAGIREDLGGIERVMALRAAD